MMIVGAFANVIVTTELPTLSQLTFLARVSFTGDDVSDAQRFAIVLLNPDGDEVVSLAATSQLTSMAAEQPPGRVIDTDIPPSVTFAAPFPIPVTQVGLHRVVLRLNDGDITELLLKVQMHDTLPPR